MGCKVFYYYNIHSGISNLKKRTETPIMPPFYHGILITNVKMQLLSEVGSLLYSVGLTLIDGSNI